MNKSRKEKNIERVVSFALDSFIENGIDGSKISDIAKSAGLTERTVFRYFATKADLVFNALLLFWKRSRESVIPFCTGEKFEAMSGIEQLRSVLFAYAEIYFTSIKELIFYHEAQTYLYRSGKAHIIDERNLIPFAKHEGPLSRAIEKGKADGTICTDVDTESLYYNTFDTLSGLIQKLALLGDDDEDYKKYARKRITDFCNLLVKAYKK